jgi:hypothetical protein
MGERAGFSFNFSGDQQFRLPPITDLGGHWG